MVQKKVEFIESCRFKSARSKNSLLALAWTNLTWKSKPSLLSFSEKTILNQLNGQINFGELTGLMGPSGAGKTTLLKCISGVNQSGFTPDSQLFISRRSILRPCFIVQDQTEQLMMNLTVKESIEYASKLKNSGVETINHKENVERLTDELLLTRCLNNQVKLCSGGEQKRLAIAMELTSLNKPNLMCFDEPTTGLDSDSAERLMALLGELAVSHRIAVVVSIHQPNHDILNNINHLYIMSVRGHCVFDGHPNDLKQHLVDCQIPEREMLVPIQCLLKVATKIQNYGDNKIDIGPEIRRLSHKTRLNQKSLLSGIDKHGQLLTGRISSRARRFSFVDFYRLLCRNATNFLIREWRYELIQALLLMLGVGIFLLLFPDKIGQDPNCPPDFINEFNLTEVTTILSNAVNGIRRDSDLNTSFLLLSTILFNMTFVMAFAFKLPLEIKLFLNENRNGWYSTSSYYLALTVMHMPAVVATNYLYSWFNYYGTSQIGMTKLWQGIWQLPESFQLFVLFSVVTVIAFQGVAIATSILCTDSPPKSMLLSILVLFTYFFYNDFMMPIHELGLYEKTMAMLSYFNLLFRSYLIVLFGGERCEGDESSVLSFFRTEEDKLWFIFQLILGQGFFWRLLAYLILLWKANDVWDKIRYKKRIAVANDQLNQIFALQEFSNRIEIDEETEDDDPFNLNNNKINNKQASMCLAWQQFGITIDRRTIFNDLNGIVNFGEITALMGPSGAGKTTLLNAINGRIYRNVNKESKIFVRKDRPVKTCFVNQYQKHHLLFDLTVKESLMYASILKNSGEKDLGSFNHKDNVAKIVEELLLTNCIDNVIIRCSGGEQKRLSIAQELTAKDKPNLLCIDEPTSGLDSRSTELTIGCLQKLAHKHDIAIVTSIHQPEENILNMFDRIYAMSNNGKCVFFGQPDEIRDHLEKSGVPYEDWQVPVEELIKSASFKGDHENSNGMLIKHLALETEEKLTKQLQTVPKDNWQLHYGPFSENTDHFNLVDFAWLTARHFKKQLIRQKRYQLALAAFVFVSGFLLMFSFPSDLGVDPGCPQEEIDLTKVHLINQQILDGITGFEQRFSQNVKLIYTILCVLLTAFALTYSFVFNTEIQVFFNEHKNGWYSTGSFFWSRNLIEIILPIPICYLFCVLIYWATSQPDLDDWTLAFYDVPWRFFLFYLVIFGSCFNAISYGILSCCIFPRNYGLVLLSYCCLGLTSIWLSGLYIPYSRLNSLLKLVAGPNYVRLSLEALVIIVYYDRCPNKAIALNMLEIEEDILYWNIGLLFVMGFIYRIISLTILRASVDDNFWLRKLMTRS